MFPRNFVKMHGLGNDFVVLDARDQSFSITPRIAGAIADRHTGAGCDQILLMEPPRHQKAAFFLRFLNNDGSEAEACGNGTRCIAWLIMNELRVTSLTIETLAGLLTAEKKGDGMVRVNMGQARLGWRDVPLAKETDTLHVHIALAGEINTEAACCSMGNPHATLFFSDLDAVDLARMGPLLERHSIFPKRVNVGFAQVLARDRLRLRIWERGSGLTLACGSAACAAVVASARHQFTARKVEVELELGSLHVEWLENGEVTLGGPTALVFSGTFDPSLFSSIPILR